MFGPVEKSKSDQNLILNTHNKATSVFQNKNSDVSCPKLNENFLIPIV